MRTSRTGLAVLGAGLALIAAACSSAPASTTAASSSSARPTASASATTHAQSPTCDKQMKLTQPASGTRFNGSNGVNIVLKVCGSAVAMRYMPVDIDPGGSVTLDYNTNTPNGQQPVLLSPAGGSIKFFDIGVGNQGVVEHMHVGFVPASGKCATFLLGIRGSDGDYTTTLTALQRHDCADPVLVAVVAVNN